MKRRPFIGIARSAGGWMIQCEVMVDNDNYQPRENTRSVAVARLAIALIDVVME